MRSRARIALVDDEPDLVEAYGEYLGELGHDVVTATSAAAFESIHAAQPVEMLVLDLNMPGHGGLDLLRRLRGTSDLPVLILTAVPDNFEHIVGLEMGADDVVTKPVAPQELAARIAGVLGRRSALRRDLVLLERATVDLTAARVLRLDRPPERLRPGEVVLLAALARHPNRILSREELMEAAPAEDLDANDRAIDNRVARLRRKLDTACIATVRGRGYMFVPPRGVPAGD